MASLLLELWADRSDYWRYTEMDERHAETLKHARKVLSRKNPPNDVT
jgi:hypothetical protein